MAARKKPITAEIKQLLKKIEKSKARLAADRDMLREHIYDLEGLLDTLDSGLQEIEDGYDMLDRSMDTISQYI